MDTKKESPQSAATDSRDKKGNEAVVTTKGVLAINTLLKSGWRLKSVEPILDGSGKFTYTLIAVVD